MSVDTSLAKVARAVSGIGTRETLWWHAPGFVGTVASGGAITPLSASVTYRTPAGNIAAPLLPGLAGATVMAATRDALTLAAPVEFPAAALEYGDAWLYTVAQGAIPVRIASVEQGAAPVVRLAERLSVTPVVDGTARLQTALWSSVIPTDAALEEPTRTPAGDLPIPYTVTWSTITRGAAGLPAAAQVVRQEGTLSLVRQPWRTGLTTASLLARWPELSGLPPVGQSGLGASILRTHEALAMRLRADVRERGLWEDDIAGAPFLPAHAAFAAASLLSMASPDRAAALSEEADRLYTHALRSAWVDANRDGIVDPGESPGDTGAMLASGALASVSERNPWAGRR